MDKINFNSYCDMCPLCIKYNVDLEDLEIFAEWNTENGVHGEKLKEYLKWIRNTAILYSIRTGE